MKSLTPASKKWFRLLLYALLLVFVLLNTIAFFHAYKFTHFNAGAVSNTEKDKLTLVKKASLLLTGIDNARPENKSKPSVPYQTIRLKSTKAIECWWLPRTAAKGTVVLFHGYGGQKASMLDKSAVFQRLGFNTLLVDFRGSGGSKGVTTTIGFKEAEEVKAAVEWLQAKGERNIVLFGTSMGAVAIMKAVAENPLPVQSIIIECPFSTLLKTAQNRFQNMGVPSFPLAHLLVFWGGVQNGYNAFAHAPVAYAKNITVPTLLLYGEADKKVTREETDAIYKNLSGPKALTTFPNAGHENYLTDYEKEWTQTITAFFQKYNTPKTAVALAQ